MQQFRYKAVDEKGALVNQTVLAESRASAMDMITAKGFTVVEVTNVTHSVADNEKPGRVSRRDVESFTRELANLLTAGVSLGRALSILSKEAAKPAAKKQWSIIYDHVAGGMSLGDSMRQFPKIFSPVYVAMVQAGETGGFLDLVLGQIAEFQSREQELKGRVKAALIYPIVLAVLASLIVVFLLIYFVPTFSGIFEDFGGHLPRLTSYIVSISEFMIKYWLLIIGAVVLSLLVLKSYMAREQGKLMFEKFVLKTPLLGKLTASFAFVRFSRMLGTLVGSGVGLITALNVAKEAIGNETLSKTVSHAVEKVQGGMPLAVSLSESKDLFPGSVIEMISVAEETGRLDKELVRISSAYESELDRNLKMAVSVAEPLMLFIMAVVVGTVVVGMLLPVFNLQELIK